ncbi:MAG: patatin-like phospholipase family protein [Sulfurimonas sp.]|nr:patatin-like phospholipase family protein [Sulfurimonas sp.]
MKIIFLICLFFGFIYANERPTIALVLSGGGARGGAHVGVLKVLDEKKIPIDFIVGTSMGSFVGGLYASGKTPQEIEKLLVTTDWEKHIRTDFVRSDTPMRKKKTEYNYQGRMGLGVDVNNNIVLPTGVLKRQPMLLKFLKEFEHVSHIKDFSKLPIPFKAVATNIKNGQKVVLGSGSLAKSVYASSSIPGGFQPINIDGIDLVDGGVSDNMPITVAKEMGADIIIAVDVSENFDENLDVNSYFVVMGQLVNILMRKNANESIATLNDKDILITPNLNGFGGLDAHKYKEIIQTGVEITQKLYDTELKHLSISSSKYIAYKNKHRLKNQFISPVIDKVVIKNPTYISDEVILGRLNVKLGNTLDEDKLREDIMHMYNTGMFDSINYDLQIKDDKNILNITTTPSWDNHGEIRFSLGLEDDFDGHSDYSLKFGYTMFGINKYGGEWKNDFEIGRKRGAYTEIFQPLNAMQRYYIKPSLVYEDTTELVPAKTVGISKDGSLEMDIRRYGATLSLGAYMFDGYEFEIGTSFFKDTIDIELLDVRNNYDAIPIYASLKIDNLDNLNFPNSGVKADFVWTKEMDEFGSDYDYEQFCMNFEKPFNYSVHNITTYLKYGSTYKKDGETALAGSFTLGGLFNLSGYVPYSLNNDNMFLGVLKYRYEIKDGGFFGTLGTSLYAGFSAEIGNTWGYKESVSYDKMHKSGTIYLAADTILGPFYLAYGFADSKNHTAYLYLGEKF